MDKYYEEDAGGATYRSGDPIKNLRLRITLQRVSPAILGFLTSKKTTESETTSGNIVSEISQTSSSVNEHGQIILDEEKLSCSWQQKHFSAREFNHYSTTPATGSVLDIKYFGEVQKIKKKGGRGNTRLFTYCDEDAFAPSTEDIPAMTDSLIEVPTYLANNVEGLRRRKTAAGAGNALSSKLKLGQGARGMKIVVEEPSEEFRQHNHVINTPVHRMLIMADLSPEGQLGDQTFEICLCEIEYDENGVLSVSPDFTRSKLPYRAETRLTRDIWLYKIDNVSTVMSRMDIKKETKLMTQLYDKHQEYLTGLVGSEFETVKKDVIRLVLNGEIVSAQSFEYDDLHVEYFLDLPRNWSCPAINTLAGCTHSCQTKLDKNIETAYFSHPFAYDTYLVLDQSEEEVPQEWPKIFVQVVSSDSWGRRRTEGYGYVSVPSVPGHHIIKSQCWRPVGNAGQEAVVYELRRFFIGSAAELEDTTYSAIPGTFDGKILNKYGVRTESTGSVTIRMNCIIQKQPEIAKSDVVVDQVRKRKQQTALQLAKGKAANEAIHNVMDAFLRARKRMQSARETVPEHIRKTVDDKNRMPQATEQLEKLSSVLSGRRTWRKDDVIATEGS